MALNDLKDKSNIRNGRAVRSWDSAGSPDLPRPKSGIARLNLVDLVQTLFPVESNLVIVLDLMLPRKNSFDVCRDLRQRGINTPIIMLTARGQVVDRVVGMKLGADDYLTKPFAMMELLARI